MIDTPYGILLLFAIPSSAINKLTQMNTIVFILLKISYYSIHYEESKT